MNAFYLPYLYYFNPQGPHGPRLFQEIGVLTPYFLLYQILHYILSIKYIPSIYAPKGFGATISAGFPGAP